MDLITDFKKIINQNTENTITSLKKIYININEDKNYTFYKDISKYYTAISSWVEVLKETFKDDNSKILLNNVLLDYCSIMHCVALGDVKLINFLFRNIIESFLRYITNELTARDIEEMFRKLSLNTNEKEKKLIQVYSSQIKQIYDDTCLYVHADTSRMPTDLTNLLDYYRNSINIEMESLRKAFERLNIALINLLKIKYVELFINMKINVKGFLDEIVPIDERVKYQNYLVHRKTKWY